MKYIFFSVLLAFGIFLQSTQAQDYDNTRQVLNGLMLQAKAQMDSSNYEAANLTFRKILGLKTKLPREMSYLFAQTLYQIGQMQNARNFVDKYLEITGAGGLYYQQALALRETLSKEVTKNVDCPYCDANGYRLAPCPECGGKGTEIQDCPYCKGKGYVMCEQCMGQGVVIKDNGFGGKKYETCSKCGGKGYHLCPVCEGKKQIETYCKVCLGTGKVSTNIICNHKPVQN